MSDYGYEDVDKVVKETSGGQKYLNFKKGDKGRVIQIRLASEPRYVNQHWIVDNKGKQSPINCGGESCSYCGKDVPQKEKMQKIAKWGWIVIDREDSLVKVFTGPTQIARSIKDISELVNKVTKKVMWGDPRTFDLQIERTEVPGASYYKVTPVVDGRGELTVEEKKKVDDSGFNLEEEVKGSKKSDRTGTYSPSAPLETAPPVDSGVVNPDELPSSGSDADETVNPDDIPF